MHLLCCAQNGVDRAGLYAFGATDTFVFADVGEFFDVAVFGAIVVQRYGFHIQQICKRLNPTLATRRALVDGIASGNGLSLRFAAGVSELAALGLWQDSVDLINNRVTFNLETLGRKPQ
jgi:hypothetical protein